MKSLDQSTKPTETGKTLGLEAGIIFLDPSEIKVSKGLDRYRQDLGDIEALAASIKRTRQILPVMINSNMELVDGGRRTAACELLGIKVKCIHEDVADPVQMRILEIEANYNQKAFTPAEEVLAIRDLHTLCQQKYGRTLQGSKGGWTLEDTAKVIGKTKGSVIGAIKNAELVDAFPELMDAKKKSEIVKKGKNLTIITEAIVSLSENAAKVEDRSHLFKLYKTDALTHMLDLEDESIDILFTDPLYGVDMDKLTWGVGGKTGGVGGSGLKIEDNKASLSFYTFLAHESYRFTTKRAHGYIFCGPEHFWTLRMEFMKAGWDVYVKPLLWIKRSTGQCNLPSHWPASCYEMLLYCRKQDSALVVEGRPDWEEHPPIEPSKRIHPYEKPVGLLTRFLIRSCLPGQVLYDPFAGSGAILECGVRENLYSIGCEIDDVAHITATKRLSSIQIVKEG